LAFHGRQVRETTLTEENALALHALAQYFALDKLQGANEKEQERCVEATRKAEEETRKAEEMARKAGKERKQKILLVIQCITCGLYTNFPFPDGNPPIAGDDQYFDYCGYWSDDS
jgi:hypothetical protein